MNENELYMIVYKYDNFITQIIWLRYGELGYVALRSTPWCDWGSRDVERLKNFGETAENLYENSEQFGI